ncbi:unnamed protein product, partial [Mesorhabditis spiculigera]
MVVLQPEDLDEFEKLLEDHSTRLIVVDFYATWCGPCKIMGPKLSKMSDQMNDIVFVKVDVDENEEIVSRYPINVMPTFIFIKDGEQIDSVEGSMEEQLRQKLAAHR